MAAHTVDGIEETLQATHTWLKDLAVTLGGDQQDAWAALRAVLPALRDRLELDESAQLAAQLPLLVRGLYYEGWDPGPSPTDRRDASAFLARIAAIGHFDLGDAEAAAHAVGGLLKARISPGEWRQAFASLPRTVREALAPER